MNKQQLVQEVAARTDISKKTADQVLNAIIDTISESLEKGDNTRLTGFGTFTVAERSARQGRHPASGKKITIPACKKATFKAGIRLAEMVNK